MNQMRKPYASTPGHFRLSWPARHAVPRSPHFHAISKGRFGGKGVAAMAVAIAFAALTGGAFGATPSPHPTLSPHPPGSNKPAGPTRVDVTKIQPKSLLPKRREHQEYVVEINKYGQVARVRTERGNGDPTFNAQTYGNVLQAFIRTPDGHVVLGTYRLTYDFDPKTARVRRDVTLVSQGGVDPDAQGAVNDLLSKIHSHTPIPIAPDPSESIDPRSLPDLNGVTAPTATPSPH